MRLPRKGVLIRLAIYVPLIGFLSWNAFTSCRARRDAEEAANTPVEPSVEDRLEPHKRIITLPDGSQQAIYELTPEEAQDILGAPVDVPDDAPPAKAEAPGSSPGD